tara:strand:+ start:1476 stop:1790 length:315 start_codon:yes stop_codon:yes gene_type:complete
MRTFLFKLLFKLTWWVAPNTPRVNRVFDLYLEETKREEDLLKCQKRQAEMDSCTQPRTPTYEHLTTKKQRDLYRAVMPPRSSDSGQPRSHYSDYQEAKAYHEEK